MMMIVVCGHGGHDVHGHDDGGDDMLPSLAINDSFLDHEFHFDLPSLAPLTRFFKNGL